MKELVIAQLRYFLVSFAWGILLMCIYDGIRVFRHYKEHSPFMEGVEDIAFWSIASFFIYRMSFYSNYGIIRAYSLFALAAGMIVYRKCCSESVLSLFYLVTDRLRAILAVPLRGLRKAGRMVWKKIPKPQDKKWIRPLNFKEKSSIMKTLWKKGDVNEEIYADEKKKKDFRFGEKTE